MAGGACYSLGNARKVFARSHDGARFRSAGLPPGLRKTCGTFAQVNKNRLLTGSVKKSGRCP